MSERQAVRWFLLVAAIVFVPLIGGAPAVADDGPQDAQALLGRLRELLAATETKVVIVPFPNSRSRILKADGSSDFFLYVERGNLRGTAEMDAFYAALDAGDMAAADDVFTRHSLPSLRASDYGWNGLGVPMERTDGGGQIQDNLYKNVGGVLGRADITPEDAETFLEYVETILIPALEGGF